MKKAVMYGAGNIGRGFIGQLFSQSGYQVHFIDVNPVIIEGLNRDKSYPVRIVGSDGWKEVRVENVCGVDGTDLELVAGTIAEADIMATAIGVNILPRIAAPLAAGLKKRWESGNLEPLNIIICENLLDANRYLEKLIKEKLDASEQELFDRTIGLVEASIGRMVPVMTPEMQEGNPLRIWVEEYCELPVDKEAFKGEIPPIVNMVPFAPFELYIQRKLFMHNMGHATTAYLGALQGCTYVWEACRNTGIKLIVQRALQESARALSAEHGADLGQLLDHADDLLYRFGNRMLGDTIARVGRDPVRKLGRNDRLAGAAKICESHGIRPVHIAIGMAAAFLFETEGDAASAEVRQTVRDKGIAAAIEAFCGIDPKEDIGTMAAGYFDMLSSGRTIEDVLEHAERLKAGK